MYSAQDRFLARLDGHQAKVLEIMARAQPLLAADATPNPALLSQKRWEMTRVLAAYKAFKHYELFDPIIRCGAPDKARIATQMKAECTKLGEDFLAHVARCNSLDVVAQWDSYRPSVLGLLARIKAHMTRERWVTESMLLGLAGGPVVREMPKAIHARP